MKKTLEQLWNGNIAPAKNFSTNDPEIEELYRLMERNKAYLDKTLSAEQREKYKKYIDCTDEYSYLMLVQAFTDGFCLASKLLTEALSEDA